ncbi:hypothetical protein, partial [Dickeya dianthicola]|uniref:hypothetical protein n=1 Tax=Dickeya dianthicola TaxID=204039 RepID=UPI001E349BAD
VLVLTGAVCAAGATGWRGVAACLAIGLTGLGRLVGFGVSACSSTGGSTAGGGSTGALSAGGVG